MEHRLDNKYERGLQVQNQIFAPREVISLTLDLVQIADVEAAILLTKLNLLRV